MGRYKCGVCGESFTAKTKRRRHKEEKHGGYFTKLQGGEEMEKEKVKRKSPIEKVQKIIIPEEQAKQEWKKYCELLKTRKDKHLKIMKESMYWAKKGKALIDVYETIQKAGLNKSNEPRFAIARADINQVRFEKRDTGSGNYLMEEGWNRGGWNTDVNLPQKLFKIQWERNLKPDGTPDWGIKDKVLRAKVPIIPAELMPEGDLKNYYILWEVKEWEKLPEVKDPFLLKRISENMFVILGAWDITELERAIIGGLK